MGTYEIICVYCGASFIEEGVDEASVEDSVRNKYHKHVECDCPYKPQSIEEQMRFTMEFMEEEYN